MIEFIQNGFVTPEGKRVVDHIEAQLSEAEKAGDIEALNQLPGYLKHFYLNVTKLHLMNEAEWLRDHNYAAGTIHQLIEDQAAEQAEKDALKEADAGLAGELEKLKLVIQKLQEDNQTLQDKVDKLEKPVSKKSSKKTDEAEAEE